MRKVDKAAFGARVKRRRDAIGVTQAQLAEAVGMKQQSIMNIEGGIVERPRRLMELAAALQTTQEWLLFEDGPEETRAVDPVDRLVEMVRTLDPNKLGVALQFLKGLEDESSRGAA